MTVAREGLDPKAAEDGVGIGMLFVGMLFVTGFVADDVDPDAIGGTSSTVPVRLDGIGILVLLVEVSSCGGWLGSIAVNADRDG